MSTNTVPVTFNMINEQYEAIGYSAKFTTRNKSEIVQILTNLGAKLVVVENHFIRNKNTSGRLACDKLQLLNITPELTDKGIGYTVQEVQRSEDMEQVIKAKLKAGKYKVCIRLDFAFARYLNWFKQYYDCSLDHVMALLIQHGLAMTMCSDNSRDYSEQDLREFEKIKRYIVSYDPDGKGILLTEPKPYTEMDFSKFKKIPVSLMSLQGMVKTHTKTPKLRSSES